MGICGVNKAIFLDRDGVLNAAVVRDGKPYPPASLAELVIPDDVLAALQDFQSQGFLLIGVTNQPDVARGTTSRATVEEINAELLRVLPLLEIRVCYHDDHHGCDCRKPLPGLLLTAAREHEIDLRQSIMIGDRWKDIEAGQRAGCRTVWLKQDYQEKSPEKAPDLIVKTMSEIKIPLC